MKAIFTDVQVYTCRDYVQVQAAGLERHLLDWGRGGTIAPVHTTQVIKCAHDTCSLVCTSDR